MPKGAQGYSADAVFANGRAFCPSIPILHKPEPSRRNTRPFPSGVAAGQDVTPGATFRPAGFEDWNNGGNHPVTGNVTSIADNTWFGINPISAGIFGVPLGFIVIVVVSLLTRAPDSKVQDLIEHVRYPQLKGDISTQAS